MTDKSVAASVGVALMAAAGNRKHSAREKLRVEEELRLALKNGLDVYDAEAVHKIVTEE